MSKTIEERFWAKVNKGDNCWEWTGSLDKPYSANPRVLPYGNIGVGPKRKARTHRVSWELHFGPVPEGMRVLHRCDNAKCVRPDHLTLGTQADNMRDMNAKGRRVSANSRKTHCKRGHPLDGRNAYHRPDRPHTRGCRICRNRSSLEKYRRDHK